MRGEDGRDESVHKKGKRNKRGNEKMREIKEEETPTERGKRGCRGKRELKEEERDLWLPCWHWRGCE